MNSLLKLKDEQLLELCRTIIISLPSDSSENVQFRQDKQELIVSYGFRTVAEFNKSIDFLFDYWKKALFHSKKPQIVKNEFEEMGFNNELSEKVASLWLEEGVKIMPKAKSLSRSGIPNVNDIRWTLNLERLNQFDGPKREPYINLQFNTTDNQKRCVSLNYEELKQLYTHLQEVQENVDSIFK